MKDQYDFADENYQREFHELKEEERELLEIKRKIVEIDKHLMT